MPDAPETRPDNEPPILETTVEGESAELPRKMFQRPLTGAIHWLVFVMYVVGVVGALWLHGHPLLTLTLLVLTPIGALVGLIHTDVLPVSARRLGQNVVVVLAMAWAFHRFGAKIAPDLNLIEAIAILGLCFVFSTQARDYMYFILVSLVLVGYGSVLPARGIYVLTLPAAIGIGILILYIGRNSHLAEAGGMNYHRGALFESWPKRMLHGALVIVLWSVFFTISPLQEMTKIGLFEPSYQTNKRNVLPPRFKRWMPMNQLAKSPDGEVSIDGKRPTHTDPGASTLVRSNQGKGMRADADGGGAASDELVMRVKCPVKMYWLAQLYDHYNGSNWKATKAFRKQQLALSFGDRLKSRQIPQIFVIEKWVTRTLPAAFYPVSLYAVKKPSLSEREAFFKYRLRRPDFPDLPFSYAARSIVPQESNGGQSTPMAKWHERLPREHYLQLPEKKISERLRLLATEITAGQSDPLDKALALREHLRENFSYTMQSQQCPDDREAADYFLFELKEGHCEYYATSLATLARLAGLPARVATGFSPGNYNTLTGHFDVHEYHAHAWTQIYVEGCGWLTMDGTPPGSMNIRTKPFVVGSFRDPFSDEWKVKAPELAKEVGDYAKREAEQRGKKVEVSLLQKLAASLPSYDEQEIKRPTRPARPFHPSAQIPDQPPPAFEKPAAFEQIMATLKGLVARAQELLDKLMTALTVKRLSTTAAVLASILLLWWLLPMLQHKFRFRQRMRKCEEWYRLASASVGNDPEACIRYCYKMIRELLALNGYPKRTEVDLFEYGASLRYLDSAACRDTLAVFYLYSQMEYSPSPPLPQEGETAFERASRARTYLLQHLTTPEPPEPAAS